MHYDSFHKIKKPKRKEGKSLAEMLDSVRFVYVKSRDAWDRCFGGIGSEFFNEPIF